jgi:hypothetical protein
VFRQADGLIDSEVDVGIKAMGVVVTSAWIWSVKLCAGDRWRVDTPSFAVMWSERTVSWPRHYDIPGEVSAGETPGR